LGKRAIALGFAVLLLSAAPTAAQYFGRNKVQYQDFDFQVLRTPHFDIHYYPAEAASAALAGRMAERWYARLSRAFDHSLSGRTPIVLYASHPHFAQTTILPRMLDEGVGGFTDHQKGRVVLPFSPGLRETDHVLGHELVHAFQRDILQQRGSSIAMEPLWFVEGMAEFLTIGSVDANTAMWVRDAVNRDRLPTIRQLGDPRWFPYRYGQALWAFLAERYGEDIAARALAVKSKRSGAGRLSAAIGLNEATLSREWHAALRAEFGARAGESQAGERPTRSTAIIGSGAGGGRLNIGPALSPDGTQIVFLSERDRYSIDVFLADAATGNIRRKIISTAADPHYESLQFIDSVGSWDSSGKRFALAALRDGHPVLTILDMPSGKVVVERPFPALDQIFDPAWSPTGLQIAFSALRGGASDLYVFDLEADTLKPITSDAFADLQPAWSPDGRTIAFATDRFTSSLDELTFGQYRLATVDTASAAIRELPSIADAKNIDPQWSGDSLYFVADPNGISNIFRLNLPTLAIDQVSDEQNGVSGIAALSPALAVADGGNRLAFSVFANGAYEIRTMTAAAGQAFPGPTVAVPATKTEQQKPANPVAANTFQTAPYRGGLSLDHIGQPYVSAGGGALGGFFRAGVSLSFSDLLERQQLETAVQVGSSARDFAVQTAYVNRRSRWTWGVLGAQLPAVFGSSRTLIEPLEGQPPQITRETAWLRQTHRQAMGLASYPFSRVQRLELTTGIHSISYGRELRTRLYSGPYATLVDERTVKTSTAAGVTLVESSAALVYDSSINGATGPVLGRRSRFEVAPTFGSFSFVTLVADYRHYFMPVRPLTVAARIEHIGRYGSGSGDARLLPLVWTLRNFVRGYSLREATSTPCNTMACESITDLGTRGLVVGNIELRFPIIGTFGLLGRSGPLPIDGLLFADAAGIASAPASSSATLVTTMIRSAGAGVRVNAGGFVFEIVAARPIDRPAAGWGVIANFRPGF
jgi:Tol biopolymer transport system component